MEERVPIELLSSTNDLSFGLQVLAVDNDSTCLRIAEVMLQSCKYEVVAVKKAMDALALLRERRGGFDLILTEVHMPEMDGLQLLETINAEFKLPVVMMSSNSCQEIAWRCLQQGASFYFVKPLTINSLKRLWQFAFLKKHARQKWKMGSVQGSLWHKKALEKDIACATSVSKEMFRFQKKRMVWTTELHKKFEEVVNEIGVDDATPKRILEMMNKPGLEKKHVSSHLQKYRLYLKTREKQLEFDDDLSLSTLDVDELIPDLSSAQSPPISNTKQGRVECMTYQGSNASCPVPQLRHPISLPTSSSGMLRQPLPHLVSYFNQQNNINCSSFQMKPNNVKMGPSFCGDNAVRSGSCFGTLEMIHQQPQMTLTTQTPVSSSRTASAIQFPEMSSNIIQQPPSVQPPGNLQNDNRIGEEADDIFNWMNHVSIFEDFDFSDHSLKQ